MIVLGINLYFVFISFGFYKIFQSIKCSELYNLLPNSTLVHDIIVSSYKHWYLKIKIIKNLVKKFTSQFFSLQITKKR